MSPDGNVYLHWEFHRDEVYACSTQGARPFILNTPGPKEENPAALPVVAGEPRQGARSAAVEPERRARRPAATVPPPVERRAALANDAPSQTALY